MSEEIMINGEAMSLTDLAGIDLTNVKEVRTSVCPAGLFHFRIKEAKLETISVEDKENIGTKIDKPICQFHLEAQNCMVLVDEELDPADYISENHYETFWIDHPLVKSLGRIKAFLVDTGLDGDKGFQDLLDESHGHEFVCMVTNTPSKNNPDKIYANLKDIMTLEAYAATQDQEDEEEVPGETPPPPEAMATA